MSLNSLLILAAIPVIVFYAIAYSPFLLDISPAYVSLDPPLAFEGKLKPNNELGKAEKLLLNSIEGPESLAFFKGDLYTGLRNGWIVRIRNDHIIEPIVSLGRPSCVNWEEAECGRPLGMRFHRNGTLFVVDAFHGIYNINVQTGTMRNIYHTSRPVDGKRPKFINDFDMTFKAGDFYFSETSNRFDVNETVLLVLESAPTGRILHHNIFTNFTRTLVDGLALPNGVQLSPKKNFLLICETGRNRVMKYHLMGKNEGKLEVFIDKLPGYPDNIRSNGLDGYWLPLFAVYPPPKSNLIAKLGPYPTVRKVLARVISAIKTFMIGVDHWIHLPFVNMMASKLTTFEPYLTLDEPYGMILELDKNGKIIRSLQSPDGYLSGISEVAQLGNALYFGSAWNRYLGKLTF